MKKKWSLLAAPLLVVMIFGGTAIAAAKKPTTATELALYRGSDRQQILEEGARKEGKLTFYTTAVLEGSVRPIVNAFQKKYPYIKVDIWRGETTGVVPRIIEEYSSGKHVVDVIGMTQAGILVFLEKGILQPFYSSNLVFIEDAAIKKAPNGEALTAGHYETGYGVAYNTKMVTKEELPKTYRDLLDPKWRGKMAVTASSTGVNWMGTILTHYGEDFVKRLAEQNFRVHSLSARGLLDLVIAKEYPIAPAIGDAMPRKSKQDGAPVDWVGLEPVYISLGAIMLAKHVQHPHAALLFIDFDLSKEMAEIYLSTGYNSPRKDIFSERKYKKYYGAESSGEYYKWDRLFKTLFLKQ